MGVIVSRAGEEKAETRQELGANKNQIRTTNALRKLSTPLLYLELKLCCNITILREKRIPLKLTSGQHTFLSASVPDPVPTLAPYSILVESTTLARTA